MAPSLDASHHPDFSIFRLGDSEINLHIPLLLGGGHIQHMLVKLDDCIIFPSGDKHI